MNQGLDYAVDIVLCIDKTGSMGPVIESVKAHATKFGDDLRAKLGEKHKSVSTMRVKVIAFGDIFHDKDEWLAESPFYDLTSQSGDFSSFVATVSPKGGGDEPESGLEALALAIKSDWTGEGHRRRHVVVVWTDASAHRLEKRTEALGFPATFDELKDLWDSQVIGQSSRRMVVFAPDAYPWSDIFNHFDEAVLFASAAGQGMQEHEYGQILDMLASSI
jgi:hypothetical protein